MHPRPYVLHVSCPFLLSGWSCIIKNEVLKRHWSQVLLLTSWWVLLKTTGGNLLLLPVWLVYGREICSTPECDITQFYSSTEMWGLKPQNITHLLYRPKSFSASLCFSSWSVNQEWCLYLDFTFLSSKMYSGSSWPNESLCSWLWPLDSTRAILIVNRKLFLSFGGLLDGSFNINLDVVLEPKPVPRLASSAFYFCVDVPAPSRGYHWTELPCCS